MALDYGYCWRTVRLYCPSAPTFLAREWVNVAYKQLLGTRRWGFLRQPITLVVDGAAPTIVLPADFGSFKAVVDASRRVRLSTWHSLDELLAVDPGLIATGPPAALIGSSPSSDPATRGRATVRAYPAGAATLTAVYFRQDDRLTDGDVFTGVLADGAEVLVGGALAQAALWPGTRDQPNPYFNVGLAQTKASEFRIGIQMLSLRDDEQYPDDEWDSWQIADCGLGAGAGDPRTTDACAC